MSGYRVSPEANNNIFEIWSWIAKDNVELADRVDGELHEVFEGLARMPGQGHRRKDLHVETCSLLSALFLPDRISACGTRNVKRVLKQRP